MQKNKIEKWNLEDIIANDKWQEYFDGAKKEIDKKVPEWWVKMEPLMDTKVFQKIEEEMEELGDKLRRLGSLPDLQLSLNSKNQEATKTKSQVADLFLDYNQKVRKISHFLMGKKVPGKKRLDEKNAKRLFQSIMDLEYQLNYSRKAAKYVLSQKEEEVVDNKDVSGITVLEDLRGIIENEFTFRFKPVGKKEKIIKTQGELLSYTHSPRKIEREAAYRSLFKKQEENIEKFFLIYQAAVKNWDYEAKIRGYTSPINMRNFANQIPDRAVEALISVCQKERGIFGEYFKYKAKMLGVKKLNRFDIYAPIKSKDKKVDLEEGVEIVLSAMGQFCPGFKTRAEQIIKESHIDSEVKNNKRSGAFCSTVSPKVTPYILLNYDNKIRDVSTLAHELGHGIHSLYSNSHYPSTQQANLPLAETASTLAEMIVFERLYNLEKDKDIKRSLLADKIADSYATILRQNYFIIFEKRAHEAVSRGITAKELGLMWLETLREQFDGSVEIDPIFQFEWSYIPHIVESPFYCYAYNFGELLSYSLYAQYKKEGNSFVPKIETILRSGGAEDPTEVLKKVGIDITSSCFWESSFDIIGGWQKILMGL